jgi:hypothetical protein
LFNPAAHDIPLAVGTGGETVGPREEGALRVLNLGGKDVDTGTSMAFSMVVGSGADGAWAV